MKTFYLDREITDALASELQRFIADLTQYYEEDEEVTLVVNSNGGSVQAGMAMYDMISALHNPITAKVIGMCASAATYPALAADKVEMLPNATMMIHPVTGGIYGNLKELEADLDWMAELEGRVKAIYASKTGLSVDRIGEMMDATTYMTAQQALDWGFVDEVEGLSKTAEKPAETPEEREETPESEDEPEKEEEKEEEEPENHGGLMNKILSLAGLKKKGEIFHRPAEDERDFEAEIKNLEEDVKAKEMTITNMAATLENKEAEFEAYRKGQLEEIERMKTSIQNSIDSLEDRVKEEVHNRLASLGYDANTLPAPSEPKNTEAQKPSDTELFLREMGLR